MGRDSRIEWTHHTFNPWRGCTKVSAGCAHCYAETLSKRNPAVLGEWGPNGNRAIAAEPYWRQPLAWNAAAKAAGERRRVFCASLGDVFEDRPELLMARFRLLALIEETPHLDWLLLTKRPENILPLIGNGLTQEQLRRAGGSPLRAAERWLFENRNVWLGTSVEDQAAADERIPHLLNCPAHVLFLSVEPLLRFVHLPESFLLPSFAEDDDRYRARWVIVGGESGPGARPMDADWVRSLRDQCEAAHVPFFFKQWGEWLPYEEDAQAPFWNGQDGSTVDAHAFPDGLADDCDPIGGWWCPDLLGPIYRRIGKKAAGRLLDGREWSEFPESTAEATV